MMMRMLAAAVALSIVTAPTLATTPLIVSDIAIDDQWQRFSHGGSMSYGGTSAFVQTDIGLNRLYLSSPNGRTGGDDGDTFVTSLWGENFKVGGVPGSGKVKVKFTVTVDGSTSALVGETYDGSNPDKTFNALNYILRAVRGTVDGFTGDDDGLEDGLITQAVPGGTRTVAVDGFETVTLEGALGKALVDDHREDGYFLVTQPGSGGGDQQRTKFYADHAERAIGSGPFAPIPDDGQAFAYLNDNYMVLDSDSLCALTDGPLGYTPGSGCGAGTYDFQPVEVEFDLNPGDNFFIYGALMVEDLVQGTIDFSHTARLTGVTAYQLAEDDSGPISVAITGASGRFQADGTGAFSIAAVPEPSVWMTMLAGFGLIGGALRRRGQAEAAYAA